MLDITAAQCGAERETSGPQARRYINAASCDQRPVIVPGVKSKEVKMRKQ